MEKITYTIHDFISNEIKTFSFDDFNILVKKQDNQWYFAKQNLTNKASEPDWKIIHSNTGNKLLISPNLPDRPLVIKPEKQILLMPKSTIEIIIPIPTWASFYTKHRQNDSKLIDYALQNLSSTWFGEPNSGILCYGLNNFLLKNAMPDTLNYNNINCLVSIINDSEKQLEIQRFLLNTDYLSIYSGEKGFYTNPVSIKHKDTNSNSEVTYLPASESSRKKGKLISESRKKPNQNMVQKSFAFIKSLTE